MLLWITESDAQPGHDVPQGGFYRVAVRQFGGGFPVAVTTVHRFVVGQHAEQGQTVLFDLGLHALVQNAPRRPVDDQAHLPVGKISLSMDVMVIIAESIVLQDADGLIYGLLCSFLLSTVVDQTIFGVNSGKLALVVTEHGEMIADLIDETVQRGSTILTGRGGYQKTDKHVVMCACNTKQMVELRRAVRVADPEAFTIILDSNEVHGTGFRTVQFGDNPDGLPTPPHPTV